MYHSFDGIGNVVCLNEEACSALELLPSDCLSWGHGRPRSTWPVIGTFREDRTIIYTLHTFPYPVIPQLTIRLPGDSTLLKKTETTTQFSYQGLTYVIVHYPLKHSSANTELETILNN